MYFSDNSTKTVKLFARLFYEVKVDLACCLIYCHLINFAHEDEYVYVLGHWRQWGKFIGELVVY